MTSSGSKFSALRVNVQNVYTSLATICGASRLMYPDFVHGVWPATNILQLTNTSNLLTKYKYLLNISVADMLEKR